MKYDIRKMNLFDAPDDYYFAHCISADFGMGKGIVIEFNKRFNMKQKLQEANPNYLSYWKRYGLIADCIKVDKVFNLITKERYFHKPTYYSIRYSLCKMRDIAIKNNITKIAMPKIGCGLDGLQFDKVEKIIKGVFKDTDIEIFVCYL